MRAGAVRLLRRKGCRIERSGRGGHVKILTPSGKKVIAPVSPSDVRHVKNLARDLKANGVEVHWRDLLK